MLPLLEKFRAVPALLLGCACGLTGCIKTTRLVQKTMPPEMFRSAGVETLQQVVSKRDAAIQTLNAAVLITASTGGGTTGKVTTYTSFRGYIFVRKPRDLRVILQLPVIGSEALDMVSNGTNFKLYIPPRHKAIVGTNVVTKPSKNGLENLRPAVFFDSLLVPGVTPGEYVALTESTRIVPIPGKKNQAIEEPDYDLAIMKENTGKALQTLRVVHINRINMLPYQQDIYNAAGQIATQALYDKYQNYGGTQFPSLITIKRPLDDYTLKVQITKLMLNQTLADDQFELKIPAGVSVQNMQ